VQSEKIIFWEVDAQEDFMTPGGKLYVPGAEKLLPNIRRLTDAARQGRVLLVSHGCIHAKDDPEFSSSSSRHTASAEHRAQNMSPTR
jgi:nicotinamidase-related amidase